MKKLKVYEVTTRMPHRDFDSGGKKATHFITCYTKSEARKQVSETCPGTVVAIHLRDDLSPL